MKPATEAELCDAFARIAEASGWRVYPECGGWDLLLVLETPPPVRGRQNSRVLPPEPGHQMGVQAKMRASCEVFTQALEASRRRTRPDECVVLVPRAGTAAHRLARMLDLRLFGMDPPPPRIEPIALGGSRHWTRHKLPEVALQGSGGCPSPRVMSPWRLGALRLVALLAERGHLMSSDFGAHSVDISRWTRSRWIIGGGREGRLTRYVAGPRLHVDGPAVGYEAELALLTTAPEGS